MYKSNSVLNSNNNFVFSSLVQIMNMCSIFNFVEKVRDTFNFLNFTEKRSEV